ncbi:MAG: PKD domain-containing protein [bacterium]|nr:PKD domain-containing protein [bacterium]
MNWILTYLNRQSVLKVLMLFVIFINIQLAFSQKQAFNWYFGDTAGLSFHTTPPTVLTNGQLGTYEGCATISTPAGRLLFYTDGISVWDSTHSRMPNGTGLKGHKSSTQSAIVVPHTDSAHLFYVFTVDYLAQANGVQYSVLNMKLNGGLGDIVSSKKNIFLHSYMCEKLTAIKHANGHDFWMLCTKFDSDSFFAYKVTSAGVNNVPVVSKTGFKTTYAFNLANSIGYLKTSPNGRKLAYANMTLDSAVIADFDPATGLISNVFTFYIDDAYGVEFSPKAKFIYFSEYTNRRIVQYDLGASSNSAFLSSRKVVLDSLKNSIGALQLGPDGKIYNASDLNRYLNVIHSPDSAKLACRTQKNYINLGRRTSALGLPSFTQTFLQAPAFEVKRNCLKDTTFFTVTDLYDLDSVKWDFNDPSSGTNNTSKKKSNIYHIYNKTGYYTVSLISYFKLRKDTFKLRFFVKDPNPKLGKDTSNCKANAITLTAKKRYVIYKWSNATNDSLLTVTQTGNYRLTVLDSVGCWSSDTIKVTFPRIGAKFKLSDTLQCLNQNNFAVKDTSTFKDDSRLKSTWYFGDGANKIDTVASNKYVAPGVYQIKLVLQSKLNCKDSISKKITVFPSSKVDFTINKVGQCFKGHSYDFTNTSTISKGLITNFNWNFGDDSISDKKDITGKTYLKDSSFKVQLITNSDMNCKDTLYQTVVVNPNPKAVFTIAKPAQCFNYNNSIFNNTSKIHSGSISGYLWNFGDSTTSTTTNITSKHYNLTDSIVVSLLAISDKGCRDSSKAALVIYPKTAIGFAIDKDTQCFEWNQFNFTNSSVIGKGLLTNFDWNFGDGSTATSKDVKNKKYSQYGRYNVMLITTSDKNCIDTLLKEIVVNASPVAAFTIDKSKQCFKNNIFNFNSTSSINNGNIVKNNWTLGNGQALVNNAINNYQYLTEDTFNVQLISLSDKGCSDTINKVVITFAQPNAKFVIPNDSQCWQKNYFNIQNSTTIKYGAMTHQWDFGDGTTDLAYTPLTKKYANNSAIYWVKYTVVSDQGCIDSSKHRIVLLERPISDFKINDSVQCFKNHLFSFFNTTTFSAMNTLTYFWDYGNGNNSIGKNAQTATYSAAQYYDVRLISYSTLTNCYDTIFRKVLPAPHAVPDFSINLDSQCLRFNQFDFVNKSVISFGQMNYNWSFGDNTGSFQKDVSKHYLSGASYDIKLVVTSNYLCKDSVVYPIVLVPHPKANFRINDSTQCLNNHTFDFANTTSINYGKYTSMWLFDDTTNGIGIDYLDKKFKYGNTHQILLAVNSDYNCTDTFRQFVYLEIPKTTSILTSENDSQCLKGNQFSFNSQTSNPKVSLQAWQWNFDDGNTSNNAMPTYNFKKEGFHKVSVQTVSAIGCLDTAEINTWIMPHPQSLFDTMSACYPEPFLFNENSAITAGKIVSYKWAFGDGDSSMLQTPIHYYKVPGLYKVRLITHSEFGCADTLLKLNGARFKNKPISNFEFLRLPSTKFEISTLQFKNLSSSDVQLNWWNFGNGNSSSEKNPEADFNDTNSRLVTLIVSNSENCNDTFSMFTGTLISDFYFYLPTSFSPDANEINDFYKPISSTFVRFYNMEIYNRWGEIVFQTADISKGWDGTYKGIECEQDVYLCKVYVIPLNGKKQFHKASLTLLR